MESWYVFKYHNPARNMLYFATKPLDEGGFGHVFLGIMGSGVPVAIKVMKKTSNFFRDYTTWLNEQSIYLRCLQHPNVISTYDQFFCDNGDLVIIMEQADGSLADLIHSGPLDAMTVCSIGIQASHALSFIHDLNIVHRDVTLRNILWFKNGTIKISDFGISKEGVSPQEFASTFIAHPWYVPPELFIAGYTTHQSDIYQLGLVLLSLLTGSHPLPANLSVEENKTRILEGVPRQIAESLIPQHGKLAEIISIMLRRRDLFRYKTAVEVENDLLAEHQKCENAEKLLKALDIWEQRTCKKP